MKNGFLKIALAAPKIRVADPEYNIDLCITAAKSAAKDGAKVVLFPELVITGATAGDLFYSNELITAAESALKKYKSELAELDLVSFIGLPTEIDGVLYNGVACVCHGEISAVSFAEEISLENKRYFASAKSLYNTKNARFIQFADEDILVGEPNVYEILGTSARIFVEVGADSEALLPTGARAAAAGANIILNPFASAEFLGSHKALLGNTVAFSDRVNAVYIKCGAGLGESGTDGVYAAPRVAASLGEILLDAPLFENENVYVIVDTDAVNQIRKKSPQSFSERAGFFRPCIELGIEECEAPRVKKSPFDYGEDGCEAALRIQAHALSERMVRAYAKCSVLGVSGGLDSTLALLAAARAVDLLDRPRASVIAITMPCFGTSKRTKSNALLLAEELGCTVRTIDIKAAVERHFKDIAHDKDNYDVVYENAQARERTQILMDVANAEGGIVVGTGDLSELALGFATYNGDHMSMYGVNASIPKTLMRSIIRCEAEKYRCEGKQKLARVLTDIVETPVSPELLPIVGDENAQYTEEIVGPYELHDFFLYYAVKFGFTKEKILRLAETAFCGEYESAEIKKYLDIFFKRFISQQFKRSCLPDGPRVTEISLSPRGAWHMPSDASGALWKK